jgi:hypothetical protein
LNLLGNAVLAKGQDVIEEKLGVKLEHAKPEELRRLEIDHEEFLVEAAIRKEELALEAEKAAQGNVTDRWKADMLSDSWLSKNIRPMTLAYWTVAITVLILLDSILESFKVKQAWIDLIETSYTIVLAAYFVGRTVQHVQNMRSRA